MEDEQVPWWRDAVLYQVYPRSFADSNGDGIGDLPGLVERLDYLEWLGIDGIWVNPVMDSPNRDWGYDVSDYCSVHPELGTLDDVDRLVSEAGRRGIRIIFDLVPNHTSDQHPWFRNALSGRGARHRDWYVWSDPKPDGSPPNNWASVFGGGPAWTLDDASGQYYLHNFLAQQPDLDWWNDEVRAAFDDILRFWFDRGIAGFRIDVAHALIKDRELRDNLPATEDDDARVRELGQRAEYNMNRPEVHDIFRAWRKLCDSYDPARILVGETFVMDLRQMASFYGGGEDELDLAFNFPFALAPFQAGALRSIVEASEELIPPQGWPVWMASNHDVRRFPSRWCRGDERRARCALVMLMGLRGTPFLYYGDEIGMTDVDVPPEAVRDPVGLRRGTRRLGRDPCRTPMQWTPEPGAGFTEPDVTPWLPLGDHRARSVTAQRDDRRSMLALCRDLIALRREHAGLRRAPYERLSAGGDGVWAWRRGERLVVALNMSEREGSFEGPGGEVLLSADRDRDGEAVGARVELRPWDALVVRTA
jgi:alpha-glucosidase